MTFFSKFFNRNIPDILERFYQHAGLQNSIWISIAVNKNTFSDSLLTKELELLTDKDAYNLKLGLKKDEIAAQLWKNHHSETRGVLRENSPAALGFNHFVDQIIEKKIYSFQRKLSQLDQKSFSTADVTNEDKALEWMRVSFSMLEKAVVQSLTDPELFFQTLLFMGINPKTGKEEIRLITFNLDIKYEFLDSNLLRVRIYNDKNEEFGSSKKAALEGDFNFRKREMLDELTRLLSVVGSGIKIS